MSSDSHVIGATVEVTTQTRKLKGIYLPSNDKKITVIKLDSGYNVGIRSSKIKSLKQLKAPKDKKEKKSKMKLNKNLPNISILHTGGTIASKVDYKTGGVFASFTPEDLLGLFPELKNLANLKSELINNMWSDDLRFKHFSLIGESIQKEIESGAQGIVISMGTDNLAVCAAALAFIVQNSPIPILLVGAQRSSDRPSSDAALNLISAIHFMIKSDFAGVAICMHSSSNDGWSAILPPTKTKKLHTSNRNAFQPVNTDHIALVNFKDKKIEFLQKKYLKKDAGRSPKILTGMEDKVGLLKISINMFPEQFEVFKCFKGLIIEGTGLGHTPGDKIDSFTKDHPKFLKILKSLSDSGTVIVMTSNCTFGNVSLNVYSKGRGLLKAGVIPGEDMLAETALVKLSWLLKNEPNKIKKLIQKNLVGEINDRIQI